MTCKFYKVFLLFLMVSVMTLGAFGQNNNSTIKGTVKDAGGAVVSGATVTLTNVGTAQELSTTSGGDGFYTFSNLSPANYKLAVSAPGFANWVGVLTLRVSQAALVDATMNAATVSTQVTVRDVTPVIDAVDPTISDVKNATAIETIPVANRNILNVLAFSPGVVAGNYGGSGAGYTRVNGMPGGSLDYLVDGQTMTNKFTNELQTDPQPTPTFQEVKIVTTSGDAQYGRPGMVELVTKSGTNQFHGQAYELNQNNHLQARTFNSGPTIPFLQHNEWGAQLGGPVWIPKVYNGKDKTFFFVDFEWIQQNANGIQHYIVPTAAQTGDGGNGADLSTVLANKTGNPVTIYDPDTTTYDTVTGSYVRTPFAGDIIPANRLNPVTQKIFGNTAVAGLVPYPRPNISNVNIWQGNPNLTPASDADTVRNKLYTAKVDHIFGPTRLAARYTYTSQSTVTPEYFAPTEPDVDTAGGQSGALTFTTVIGPRMVNVARAGVTYNHSFTGPLPIPGVATSLGLPSYSNTIGWPQFEWQYSGNDSYWTSISIDNPKDYPDQTVTASDQFSYNRGNHQLTFGFEVSNYRLTTFEVGQPGGTYGFSGNFSGIQDPSQVAQGNDGVPLAYTGLSLADFLLGDTNNINLNTYPTYHTRQTEFDGFAQDNWRATQNLTVNLGLRYEYWTAFTDAAGLYSTFDPNITSTYPSGVMVYAGKGPLPAQTPQAVLASFQNAGLPIESSAAAGYPSSLFNMPKDNFEPRIGFAYQMNDKTVIRGGYGIYQWVIPLQQFQQATRKNPPFSYSSVLFPGEIDGASTNAAAAELEFPIASALYGGPQPVNQFMLGSQGCTNQPAGTCNPPGLELNTSNVSISQGNGFSIAPMNPNYKPSRVQEYNLTFARELPYHTGFQLSYIGNHSNDLLQFDPINYTVPRDNCVAAGSTNVAGCQSQSEPQYTRAYAVFGTSGGGNNEIYDYNGYANSNELQAQVTHTFGNGLLLQSYFTWGRFLTTTEAGLLGQGAPGAQSDTQSMVPASLTPGYTFANPLTSGASTAERLRAVYTNDPTLPDKTFQLNAHYQLPFGKGQRFFGNAHGIVNALVSGYNISPFFLWHSGFYFAPYATMFSSNSNNLSGNRGISLAPGKTGILPKGQRNANQWFNPTIWDPTSGTAYAGQTYELTQTSQQGDYRNNIPFNYMTGPGFNNMDANIYKLTPLWRNLVFDFEAQFFNIYNHQNLGMPNSSGIITATAGGPSATGNAFPRTIQLQAKFLF
jgi:hypothetical protein